MVTENIAEYVVVGVHELVVSVQYAVVLTPVPFPSPAARVTFTYAAGVGAPDVYDAFDDVLRVMLVSGVELSTQNVPFVIDILDSD